MQRSYGELIQALRVLKNVKAGKGSGLPGLEHLVRK